MEWKQSATAIKTAVKNETGFALGMLTLIFAARASRLLPPAESACIQNKFVRVLQMWSASKSPEGVIWLFGQI